VPQDKRQETVDGRPVLRAGSFVLQPAAVDAAALVVDLHGDAVDRHFDGSHGGPFYGRSIAASVKKEQPPPTTRTENRSGRIYISMTWITFNNWITADIKALFRLLEVSTEFPRTEINDLFNRQIDQLRHQVPPELRRELEAAKGFDLCGYVAKSLRNAGFQNADIDPMTQNVIVRLLIAPGNLVSGWQGSPSTFMPRVKLSVRNSILNLVDKKQRRRRWIAPVRPDQIDVATHLPPESDDETIEQFREKVQEEVGDLALAVLDARLDGVDVKSLVGRGDLFTPSHYQIKKAVQQVKALAASFGDESFRLMVQRAMDAEQETLARRFGTVAAVPG